MWGFKHDTWKSHVCSKQILLYMFFCFKKNKMIVLQYAVTMLVLIITCTLLVDHCDGNVRHCMKQLQKKRGKKEGLELIKMVTSRMRKDEKNRALK